MDPVDAVLERIRSLDEVMGAFEMDDEVSEHMLSIEKEVRTQSDTEYRNLGYDDAMSRQVRICCVYGDNYDFQLDSSLVRLMTEDGTVLGQYVPDSEREQFLERDDVLWASDDFVVFFKRKGIGNEVFVLGAQRFRPIEGMPGIVSPIMSSPAGPSDAYLKQHFGYDVHQKGLNTIVIAFDVLCRTEDRTA